MLLVLFSAGTGTGRNSDSSEIGLGEEVVERGGTGELQLPGESVEELWGSVIDFPEGVLVGELYTRRLSRGVSIVGRRAMEICGRHWRARTTRRLSR